MNKILVAYDGGEPGDRALALAARLAHAFGSRVDVVSVVPEGFGRVEARAQLREQGIDAGLIEPAGDPAQTIERLAAEGAYDTIIVGGSRGQASGRPWTETVAAHVAANATTTVIVAH